LLIAPLLLQLPVLLSGRSYPVEIEIGPDKNPQDAHQNAAHARRDGDPKNDRILGVGKLL